MFEFFKKDKNASPKSSPAAKPNFNINLPKIFFLPSVVGKSLLQVIDEEKKMVADPEKFAREQAAEVF